jgi:Glycosyltransferase family 87
VTELAGLLWLAAALTGLVVAAALVASCLRIHSLLEHALATYLLAWAWLVAVTYLLSPPGLVTRGWLTAAIAVGLAGALATWLRLGRPAPPAFRAALGRARDALRRPALLVLAIAVAAGAVYTTAIAFLTPVNEWDSLGYHVARAMFWKQEHRLGYIEGAVEPRLDVNPPNAEIGQLATLLLSGGDRYVALTQLAAYAALAIGVAALGRRIGLRVPEAMFGALAFATLPIVAVQASSGMNDLVVASFLLAATVFALRPGRASLVVLALAVGLALGTKFTAVLALPVLALVAAAGRPPRDWPRLALAGLGGAALGTAWYVVNLVETGEFDGGLADDTDQRAALSPAAIATTVMRLLLDLVDFSGSPSPYEWLFVAAGVVLALLAIARFRRSSREGAGLLAAGALCASLVFLPDVADLGQRGVHRAWYALGEPEGTPFDAGWGLNVEADPTDSWFGPLGVLLLCAGTAVVVLLRWRGRLPTLALALALAPWIFLLMLAVTLVWDPWRGRMLVFGVALAAATWGVLLRYRAVPALTAAVGAVALGLSLANYQGKPSGLGSVWERETEHYRSVVSVWSDERRWQTQVRLLPLGPERTVLRFAEEDVAEDAEIAITARRDEFLAPLFGERLSRRVSLVKNGETVPSSADWFVQVAGVPARRCPGAWQVEWKHRWGWQIERRVGPDDCLS